jgi:hypothetical protein
MMAQLKISMETNIKEVTGVIDRMAEYFETAPDDCPIKAQMVAFGEIDADRDLLRETTYQNDVITVSFSLSPELQRIADMVPADDHS